MKKVNELRKELLPGDAKALSLATGFTSDYVRRVLRGTRYNPIILQAASDLIKNRAVMRAKFTCSFPQLLNALTNSDQ